jgi:hypothetical protein
MAPSGSGAADLFVGRDGSFTRPTGHPSRKPGRLKRAKPRHPDVRLVILSCDICMRNLVPSFFKGQTVKKSNIAITISTILLSLTIFSSLSYGCPPGTHQGKCANGKCSCLRNPRG